MSFRRFPYPILESYLFSNFAISFIRERVTTCDKSPADLSARKRFLKIPCMKLDSRSSVHVSKPPSPPPPPLLLFRHLWKLCCFVDIIDTGKSTGSPFFKRENYAQVKWEMRSRRKIIEDIPDNWNEINFPDNEINLCFATIGRPSSQVARLHTFFQINEERIISRYVYIYPRPWKNTANIEIEIEIVPYARWINDENKLCFIKRKRGKKKNH